MSQRTVWWFMAITFAIGWGVGAMLFLFTDQIEALFGPVSGTNPVFILLVWSPAIAGITLVWRNYGRKGVGSFMAVQVNEPGRLVVYYEGNGNVSFADLVVAITDPDGTAVTTEPYEGELIYETADLTRGQAIASFDATQTGEFES